MTYFGFLKPSLVGTRIFIGKPYFFFQAEDGIRDGRVTGVQTCALPILAAGSRRCRVTRRSDGGSMSPTSRRSARSEERRVGKECRSRWAPERFKKRADDQTLLGLERDDPRPGDPVDDQLHFVHHFRTDA